MGIDPYRMDSPKLSNFLVMLSTILLLAILALIEIAIKVPMIIALVHGLLMHLEQKSDAEALARKQSTDPNFSNPEAGKPELLDLASKVPESEAAVPVPVGMRNDHELGLLYIAAPSESEQDDLQQINGVAAVLEEKLHAVGIFTYSQIVQWTDIQVMRFGERLSFKGRIQRDQWQGQCSDLHRAKYQEDLTIR